MSHRGRFVALFPLALALISLPGSGPLFGTDRPPRPLVAPPRTERDRIRSLERGSRLGEIHAAAQQALLTPGAPVDVENYVINMRVSLGPNRVDGSVRLTARVLTAGLATLDVGLFDEMQVTSILEGITPLAFTRSANKLHINLGPPRDAGQLIDIVITYGGTPPVRGYGSFNFATHNGGTQPVIFSLSEPTYAPTWWPCIDDPADKAIVEMNLTVPGPLTGVSNGKLVSTVSNADGTKTFLWQSDYPISTYLVSVAITNYATWTDTYSPVTGGLDMLVQHWVYPEHLADAQQDLSVTVPMLEFFSSTFGEYPFVAEKYGHAIFAFGGGMEHQTVTSYGAPFITGDNDYDWIVAHEMAHQWWGDSVTLADWRETWLNEGFASYSEALWTEHLGGAAALRGYMAGFDSRPFCGPLYNSGCNIFGHTIYDKGAWVLHMLRHVIGDASFLQALRDWASDFAFSNATTADLRATMEAASGRYLGDFFDRWVYQTGEPAYRWGWTAAQTPAGWITHVRIEQTQAGAPFIMPIDLRIWTGEDVFSTAVVENTSAVQDFALPPVPDRPVSLEFDPGYWILKSTTVMTLPDGDTDGVPDTADNCTLAINPAQEDLDGDGAGDACDTDLDGDGRSNALDCAPQDATTQDPPGEATGLDVTGAGGAADLTWDPDLSGSSSLTYEVARGDALTLIADAGTGGSACFASGLVSPQITDVAQPEPGAAFYYYVLQRNTCGLGPPGTDFEGLPRAAPSCP